MKGLKLSVLTLAISTPLMLSAASIPPAPAAGELGRVVHNPYNYAPLSAVIETANKNVSDVKVTVKGKGAKGIDISYEVGPKSLLTHDGIPVVGMYANFRNTVEVSYKLDGKSTHETYTIQTPAISDIAIDNRSLGNLQAVEVKTVAPGFEDRLYMVNSFTYNPNGADLAWRDGTGAANFDLAPNVYIIDTQGEYRWWLDQSSMYDINGRDIDKRGSLMGIRPTERGSYTFVRGQKLFEMDLTGRMARDERLPRGYQDATHEAVEMPNGDVLVRAAKRNYLRPDGTIVHTVRDHILQIDPKGQLVDVWDLNTILDPMRDDFLVSMDAGAVCMNVDTEQEGQTVKVEPDAPYGDIPGVGTGRNWAHVNSIAYDEKDDSIIISSRHQSAVIKIGRNKEVTWIIAARAGWNDELASKVLQPVNSKGKKINCTENGKCEDNFDFTWSQHTAWISSKGTITVLDNGEARHMEQPALPSMKYTRFVEYKVNEKQGTVEQVWEYGKERGYDWYSPITSVTEYRPETDTMFGFGGSIEIFNPEQGTRGRINEIDYKTKEVKVEIDVFNTKPHTPHYRSLIVEPNKMFSE
ncbi:aryl-sulfate sulfotransferase [Ferrimonas pelagia]|uniref:Aryl-sulfate sulfotransferase n=1 Tax=Ferrimonas pelagia TaxID=1177826 RepID=A0ABP9F8Y9_9GAMM